MLVRNIHEATHTNILPPPPKFHPHFHFAPTTSLQPHFHSVLYLTCIQASLTFCPLLDLYPSALTFCLLLSSTHTNILLLTWPPPTDTNIMSLYCTSTFCLFLLTNNNILSLSWPPSTHTNITCPLPPVNEHWHSVPYFHPPTLTLPATYPLSMNTDILSLTSIHQH